MQLVIIGLGGFAGAVLRHLVDGLITQRTPGEFPWGTLAVNASGSLILGILFAVTAERVLLPPEIRGPVMIGFLGAYTTFSTLAFESWRLIEDGAWLAGVANLGASVVVGLGAVIIGLAIGRAI